MAPQHSSDISRLRTQMEELRPGVLDNAVETAAPFIAKALGYAELIRAVLPQLQAVRGAVRGQAPAAEQPAPPRPADRPPRAAGLSTGTPRLPHMAVRGAAPCFLPGPQTHMAAMILASHRLVPPHARDVAANATMAAEGQP